ncbi:hypothetical protein TOT_010000212 [Theileria orientalis strain Shintoku]|uniref:Uncharacterized protein n=1 Tax=Theileria orientalis strain Shintoku TaxID=869250 RepID=J7MEU7_THEOR|nr:hypothetical protein TOT_010000212 [Theileria orientalis strain Shintoku]BAM38744.1 hypothetical protein TOT_010000212 [Theileria orientalis strain Shintoku]|eukprot:XP_009689045.1 hypothetical protein TOT_010000212 [Theileria orientalis strain Shintoku]
MIKSTMCTCMIHLSILSRLNPQQIRDTHKIRKESNKATINESEMQNLQINLQRL